MTGLPYSQDSQVDPLTGQTYLAEAQQYGSVSAAEQAVAASSSLDYSSAYGTGYGAVGTSSAAPLVTANTTQATTYASNSAWAQAVEAGLSTIGYSSTDIAAALGRYLGSLSETPDQASIVGAALAEFGPPPVGSYQIILASSTTTAAAGTTSTGTTGTTTGTGTGTTSIGPAYPAPSNLHQTVYPTQASLAANAVPNALCHYQVLQGRQIGHRLAGYGQLLGRVSRGGHRPQAEDRLPVAGGSRPVRHQQGQRVVQRQLHHHLGRNQWHSSPTRRSSSRP